ncbi:oxygenase MpaB family protein [Nocardioides sp. C4-1]|uniref:oxygenase MpaB family protein n=1 Tax=Nocardioides sp. C4-1 TaxID=3151851 RepID=UPI0032645834
MTTMTTTSPPPTRFREAEARGRRLGRPLRAVAAIQEVDEALMTTIGERLTARDELGAELAHAMRLRVGSPGRVTHADLRTALHDGIDAVAEPAPALVEFLAHVSAVPDWVDWDLLHEGGEVFNRFGQNAADVLTQLSLVGGYRFGGPTDLLVATGGLTGGSTRRRLAETQKWATTLSERDALRPGGEAWRLTLHVRAMHALVNASFEPRWATERWGLPINRTDLAATLGLFDAVTLLGVRGLGVPVSRRDSQAAMHLWKYVGWLLGVDDDWLVDSERERHRINYHLLLAQSDVSEAGPRLAGAVVGAQVERHYDHLPALRRRFERERLLSMLTVFLGPQSMRELGLPVRPPWAFAYVVPLNVLRYRSVGRTPWGRRHLDRWGRRVSASVLRSYYGDDVEQHLGPLGTG